MPKTCLDSSRDQFSFKNQPQSNPRLRPLIVAEGAPGSICFPTFPRFGNSSAFFPFCLALGWQISSFWYPKFSELGTFSTGNRCFSIVFFSTKYPYLGILGGVKEVSGGAGGVWGAGVQISSSWHLKSIT